MRRDPPSPPPVPWFVRDPREDGASVSFTDDYRFEAREDVPTILGD